jgi:putative aminopeptidase FrvX
VQTVVLTSYGSDATLAKSRGSTARAVLIGYPGDNTHGYEICHLEALYNSTRLLLAYLYKPLS